MNEGEGGSSTGNRACAVTYRRRSYRRWPREAGITEPDLTGGIITLHVVLSVCGNASFQQPDSILHVGYVWEIPGRRMS